MFVIDWVNVLVKGVVACALISIPISMQTH